MDKNTIKRLRFVVLLVISVFGMILIIQDTNKTERA